MLGPPTRQTRAATERRRSSWHGLGVTDRPEKDGIGVFLDDVVYAFADISVVSLPVLYLVMAGDRPGFYGVKTSILVVWMATVLVAALIRGGWITPLGSGVPGWVSLTPVLVAARLPYYNATFAGCAYLTGFVLELTRYHVLSILLPAAVGGVAIAAFPAVADRVYALVVGE
ncbi:hypothetical protein ACFQE8_10965 [Salinirubellus sp. GCM10025818]|uniref:hypothetical protein n=1 Tax=Salinirubellus TaxID=2162630 RepID=UPI0030CC3CA8